MEDPGSAGLDVFEAPKGGCLGRCGLVIAGGERGRGLQQSRGSTKCSRGQITIMVSLAVDGNAYFIQSTRGSY